MTTQRGAAWARTWISNHRPTAVALGLVGALATSAMAEERREAGAHEHGHSSLRIAIEGRVVSMELEAPGADIVGFEHAAETDADKAAVTAAKTALADPLALFVLPRAAECRLVSATVEVEAKEEHAEFHVAYALDCAKPDALATIDFAYFTRFPNAEDIDVTVVTGRGQSAFEIKRDAPRLSLRGLM